MDYIIIKTNQQNHSSSAKQERCFFGASSPHELHTQFPRTVEQGLHLQRWSLLATSSKIILLISVNFEKTYMHCQGGMSKPRGVLCTLPKGIKMQLVPKAEFQTLLIYPQLQTIQVALDNIKINTVQMSSNLANCKSKDICANLFYSICFCTSVVISDQASTFSSALHLTTWI